MKNLIVSLVIAGVTQLASAQGYPAKPIRIIAAYGPGSTVDIFGRIIAPKLQEAMGQPVIVENRAGAGGNIGTAAVAKAAPDGYTLGLVALGPLVQNPVLYSSVAFDPVKDFAAISLLATGPAVMAVHPSIPAKNVKELVNLAKRRPGELNLGSNGVGSATHIAGEMFKRLTDTDMVHVPYKGNAETITALIGGQVSILFTGVPPVVGLAKAGKVRLLVTTGRQRIPSLPEVPTVAEAGLPAAEMVLWYGVAAPAATPKDIIARLHLEIVKAMSLPEVRQLFSQQGVDPETNSPEQFAQLIRDEYARWGKIIRAAGIKLE